MRQDGRGLRRRALRQGGGQPAPSGRVRPDFVLRDELASPGADRRCGVNLICRPPEHVLDYVYELQEYLREAEPAQYYYPPADLHLTLFEICHSRTPEDAEALALRLRAHINELVAGAQPVKVCAAALAFDQRGCALSFTPTGAGLQRFRQAMAERLVGRGMIAAPRYEAASAHVTLMRYIKTLRSEPQAWALRLLRAPRREQTDWTLSEVWITWGANWYGMRSRIAEAGPFRLG